MAKIPKAIVITTSKYTEKYLPELLESIKDTKYPILLKYEGYELGGISLGKESCEEFVFLMDSCIIKDISLFDKLFSQEGNVFITEGGYHYMGKFVSDTLPDLPKIDNKNDAIAWELRWLKAPSMGNPLPVHTNVFEEKHGQRRMKLENDYIIKYKGTYHL